MAFLFFWPALLVIPIWIITTQSGQHNDNDLFHIYGTLLFCLVGMAYLNLIYHGSKKIVFDLKSGYFWTGVRQTKPSTRCRLAEIAAIQIIEGWVKTSKDSWLVNQLNLVLQSGKRLNVLRYGGNINDIREAALKIQKFLGNQIPIWDATQVTFKKELAAHY